MSDSHHVIRETLQTRRDDVAAAWAQAVKDAPGASRDARRASRIELECRSLLSALELAAEGGGTPDSWRAAYEKVDDVARARVEEGVEPAETAAFVSQLRRPLLEALPEPSSAQRRVDLVLSAFSLLDKVQQRLVLAYVEARDRTITRHQEEVMELSTPVVKLWDGLLALPLVGTLDSQRAQTVLEVLLGRVAETECRVAIIDITGVPTVDTLVAQNLIKAVTATRLMGAECILSGIRPQIAQTIVQLGVDLSEVTTKATLADAFSDALRRFDLEITARPSNDG